MKYMFRNRHKRIPNRIWLVLFSLIVIFVGISFFVDRIYYEKLAPASASPKSQIITIKPGSSIRQIGDLLEQKGLIQSSWAMQLYVDTKNYNNNLQAGTYALSADETTQQIVNTMVTGHIQTNLVTILPGRRIDQVRDDLINSGYAPGQVDSALNPALYRSLPVLAFLPKNASTLEGMLWPDSFERNATTPVTSIISESLNEMASHLNTTVQAQFAAQGLSTYQGLILSSIVNQEVSKPTDQAQVAQVFLSRLQAGSMLQSDITAFYGAIENGQKPSITYDSPYNTYLHTGLPPTPVSSISLASLNSVTHPASTSWLYFVAGDNGTTYFANTSAEQQANVAQYCHKLCGN